MEFRAGREFFVADAYWLPPDEEPIGPMALEATCAMHGSATTLNVRQSGWSNSRRWNRYYDIIGSGFALSLNELKQHVEERWTTDATKSAESSGSSTPPAPDPG